ncbi:hypothetical protein [Selenomonas artemidis]|uniref:hypothetical protein n=1 Tax=Selenomonas artemidis TaxID=671224 RepID=UPI00047C4A2C|nr:hypothetical protein [Selenomonas artemidis]
MTELTRFAVGDRWPGEVFQQDGLYFDYTDESGASFVLFFSAPNKKEIDGVKDGKIELAITVKAPVIFMCAKIQGVGTGWMDAPYSIRRHPGATIILQPAKDGEGLPIQFFLVDIQTKKICAIRLISTDSKFANYFRRAVLTQLGEPYSTHEYDSKIFEVYQSLSSKDLAQRADVTFRTR